MSWIKISDENGGTYALEASPDPRAIITIDSLQAEIDALEAEPKPTDEELIEEGKTTHPYYMDRERQIEELKKQIENITNGE